MGLSALQPVESTRAPHWSAVQTLTYVPLSDGSWSIPKPSLIYPFLVHHDSLPISPHPIIPITLIYHKLIPTHALIDSGSQSSLISESFSHQHFLTQNPLDHPIPICGLDGSPLSKGLMSDVILVNLHIQNHSKHIYLGVVNMSYDILLGVDWLRKHNLLIDWESNQLTLSCCGTNLVQSRSGAA